MNVGAIVGRRVGTWSTLIFGKCPLCPWKGRARSEVGGRYSTPNEILKLSLDESRAHIARFHPEPTDL